MRPKPECSLKRTAHSSKWASVIFCRWHTGTSTTVRLRSVAREEGGTQHGMQSARLSGSHHSPSSTTFRYLAILLPSCSTRACLPANYPRMMNSWLRRAGLAQSGVALVQANVGRHLRSCRLSPATRWTPRLLLHFEELSITMASYYEDRVDRIIVWTQRPSPPSSKS